MIDMIAAFDRRLNESWFDGVLAVVAAGGLTVTLRLVAELVSAA
jgi:hypothetical protein